MEHPFRKRLELENLNNLPGKSQKVSHGGLEGQEDPSFFRVQNM